MPWDVCGKTILITGATSGICGIRPPRQGWNHPGEALGFPDSQGVALGSRQFPNSQFPRALPWAVLVCPVGAPTTGPISVVAPSTRTTTRRRRIPA